MIDATSFVYPVGVDVRSVVCHVDRAFATTVGRRLNRVPARHKAECAVVTEAADWTMTEGGCVGGSRYIPTAWEGCMCWTKELQTMQWACSVLKSLASSPSFNTQRKGAPFPFRRLVHLRAISVARLLTELGKIYPDTKCSGCLCVRCDRWACSASVCYWKHICPAKNCKQTWSDLNHWTVLESLFPVECNQTFFFFFVGINYWFCSIWVMKS